MFRNEKFKSMFIKLILFQLIFSLIGFSFASLYINNINKKVIERDMALVGNIIKDHPQLKDELIPYITKEVKENEKNLGKEILKEYGYTLNNVKSQQPILKGISPKMEISLSFMIISFTLPLGYMLWKEYKKIFNKVQDVYNVAEKVVEGDFNVYLKEEGEGDFNILNHQFNQMANRLENSLEILKKEKTFLKNILSDISHQLKTPLSSLVVFNDILIEDENMDWELRKDFLEKERTQLERMEWLIINLLKVARIEAGAIEFKKEKVSFNELLYIPLNALIDKLEDIEINIIGNQEVFFYGDKNWTGEALINIVKNATEHGGEKITIEIEETPLFSNIIIKDNGEGIDENHLPHLFERFYKVSNDVKPDSIGIGLNLAKLIVESQEGTISVKSKKGEGTEFIITFLTKL